MSEVAESGQPKENAANFDRVLPPSLHRFRSHLFLLLLESTPTASTNTCGQNLVVLKEVAEIFLSTTEQINYRQSVKNIRSHLMSYKAEAYL